jgi:monoamine oxidase
MHPFFKTFSLAERKAAVRSQLEIVFGASALNFLSYEECIWSAEEHTFQPSNQLLLPHLNNGYPIFSSSYFENTLFISSSESSLKSSGYMDGAVYAANETAKKIIALQENKQ